ncbi:immunoglobulin-like domain-containing protein [Enterococcus rotai]|uniref:immunoglobulin-like domain-containing protein n=1 Tax=Enterococcus rotai TaxID=118060 RepID=UPI0032B615CB
MNKHTHKKKNKRLLTLLATTGIFMNSAMLPIVTAAEGINQPKNESTQVTEATHETKATDQVVVTDTEDTTKVEASVNTEEQAVEKNVENTVTMNEATPKAVSDTSLFDFNVTLTETGKLAETIVDAIKWYEENWHDLEAGHSMPEWGMQQNINITTTVPLNDADWETVRNIPQLSYTSPQGVELGIDNVDIVRLNSQGFDLEIPDDALNFKEGGSGSVSDPFIVSTWLLRSFESNATRVGDSFGSFTWALESVSLPNAKLLGNSFLSYSLTQEGATNQVYLPEVEEIGDSAFHRSRGFDELTIPKVKKIGNRAFVATKMKALNLPELVEVGSSAFSGGNTSSMPSIFTSEGVINPNGFNSSIDLELPKLTSLGNNSFSSNTYKKVSLPAIKKIDNSFNNIAINSVQLSSLEEVGNNSFNISKSQSSTKTTALEAPNLKKVGSNSFYLADISGLALENLVEVGDSSFKFTGSSFDLSNLSELVSVGDDSFNNVYANSTNTVMHLSDQLITKEFNAPKLEQVGSAFLKGVSSLEDFQAPNLNKIGDDSFSSVYVEGIMWGETLDFQEPEVKVLDIGFTSLSEVQNYFEASNSSLTNLTMNAVEEIADNDLTLNGFEVLENLTMNSVTSVGDNVLKDLTSLNTVEMLQAETFGASAFEQALALETVNLPKATTFGNNAFDLRESTSQLEQVALPEVQRMGDNAFRGAGILNEVTLPKLQEIGSFAFYMTRELKVIHLPSLTKIDTTQSFGGTGRTDALIFTKGNLSNETLNLIFSDKPKVLGVLTSGNTEQELLTGDQLYLGEGNLINETTATIERAFTWNKDGVLLDHSLIQYQKEHVTLEDSGVYVSNILLNDKEYTLSTHSVIVTEAPEEVIFETDDYYIGDYNITGRFSAPIVTAQLRIDGEISNRGGTFNKEDGTFYYYAGAGRIQTGQDVVLEGLDSAGNVVETVKIEPKVVAGSLDNVQYVLGESTITGEYTGNMSKARLVVNGTIISVGGTFKDGVFSYYVNPSQLKETDTIQMQGYDAEGNPIGDLTPVSVQKQSGQLLEANYTMGQTTITGKYEGNVKKGRLFVDGKQISVGGTFKEGIFSYYVAAGTIKPDSVVELAAYGDGDVLLSESFNVTVHP